MKNETIFVTNREGDAIAGAEVYVRVSGSLVDLYSDNGVTLIDNPQVTDINGRVDFYTADGVLSITIFADGEQQGEAIVLQHYDDQDNEIAALRSVTSAADKLFYFTGSGTGAVVDFTAAGRALIDDADASAQRTTLGLGTIATQAANNVAITGGSIVGITDLAVADGGTGASTAAGARTNLGIDKQNLALPLTFNFSDNGEARYYADEAMTLTQQATSGTGSVAYEKSTNAAPSTFSSTTSPIALEAGAWLKVTASSVSSIYAVHLKRTA